MAPSIIKLTLINNGSSSVAPMQKNSQLHTSLTQAKSKGTPYVNLKWNEEEYSGDSTGIFKEGFSSEPLRSRVRFNKSNPIRTTDILGKLLVDKGLKLVKSSSSSSVSQKGKEPIKSGGKKSSTSPLSADRSSRDQTSSGKGKSGHPSGLSPSAFVPYILTVSGVEGESFMALVPPLITNGDTTYIADENSSSSEHQDDLSYSGVAGSMGGLVSISKAKEFSKIRKMEEIAKSNMKTIQKVVSLTSELIVESPQTEECYQKVAGDEKEPDPERFFPSLVSDDARRELGNVQFSPKSQGSIDLHTEVVSRLSVIRKIIPEIPSFPIQNLSGPVTFWSDQKEASSKLFNSVAEKERLGINSFDGVILGKLIESISDSEIEEIAEGIVDLLMPVDNGIAIIKTISDKSLNDVFDTTLLGKMRRIMSARQRHVRNVEKSERSETRTIDLFPDFRTNLPPAVSNAIPDWMDEDIDESAYSCSKSVFAELSSTSTCVARMLEYRLTKPVRDLFLKRFALKRIYDMGTPLPGEIYFDSLGKFSDVCAALNLTGYKAHTARSEPIGHSIAEMSRVLSKAIKDGMIQSGPDIPSSSRGVTSDGAVPTDPNIPSNSRGVTSVLKHNTKVIQTPRSFLEGWGEGIDNEDDPHDVGDLYGPDAPDVPPDEYGED